MDGCGMGHSNKQQQHCIRAAGIPKNTCPAVYLPVLGVPALPKLGGWIDWQHAADPALAQQLRQIAGQARQLLHLDYHPLNVLAHTMLDERRQISAVIDWANATHWRSKLPI
jgi:hypothetical protein